ncbi:MAG: hypothetical protein A2X59_11635 [Nitrospirae bacterium GWC2_42_7]|nr:MAG: hypothetical protein A2X59_11635 [Nitrospirae bacterium GWC2_42_7]
MHKSKNKGLLKKCGNNSCSLFYCIIKDDKSIEMNIPKKIDTILKLPCPLVMVPPYLINMFLFISFMLGNKWAWYYKRQRTDLPFLQGVTTLIPITPINHFHL